MPYEVSTPVFEGPFDLLLHLILKEEVDLWEISLGAHRRRVLRRGREHGAGRSRRRDRVPAHRGDARRAEGAPACCPGREDVDLDEELMRFEERDLLLARLLECKTFQDAARVMNERLQIASRSIARTAGPEEPFRSLAPDPLERVALEALLAAARRGLAPKVVEEVETTHIAPIRASVRDAIDTVLALLPERGAVQFRELTYGVSEKLEIIVRFLAVLELFKQGVVDLEQVESFGELMVRPLAAGERVALDLSSLEEWGDEPSTGRPDRRRGRSMDARVEEQV